MEKAKDCSCHASMGPFKLYSHLGSGKLSDCYLGKSNDDQWFAIKIFKEGQDFLKYNKDIVALDKIKHENVIRLEGFEIDSDYTDEFGKEGFRTFLQLELGEPCIEYFYDKDFSDEECRFFFKQVIEAIDSMHQQHIYHRDLKPQNLLFDESYNMKISNFGLAKILTKREGEDTDSDNEDDLA